MWHEVFETEGGPKWSARKVSKVTEQEKKLTVITGETQPAKGEATYPKDAIQHSRLNKDE